MMVCFRLAGVEISCSVTLELELEGEANATLSRDLTIVELVIDGS